METQSLDICPRFPYAPVIFDNLERAMRVSEVSEGAAFQLFLLLVAMAWLAMFWAVRRNKPLRKELFWIGGWSLPGSLLVGAWHRTDFWNPPSWLGYPVIQPVFTMEDELFGLFFAGLVAVLVPFQTGRHLQDQPISRRVTRRRKVGWLISSVAAGVALSLTPVNSVVACGVMFFLSTLIICYRRTDLRHVAMSGALLAFAAYGMLVGLFLLITPNRAELAQSMCQFYVRHGVLWTGVVLTFWALSFGAWIAVLYPFITNKRFVVFLTRMARSD